MLREKPHCFLLDDLLVLVIDCVPKLRFPLMDEIDPRKVKVFSVPAEEGFPASHVAVRCIYSFDLGLKGIRKK